MSLVSSNGWKGALAGCLALAAGVAAADGVRRLVPPAGDATALLQAAFDDASVRRLVLGAGDYLVEPMTVRRPNLEIVLADGARIYAAKGKYRDPNDRMITVYAPATNIVIRGEGKAVLQMRIEDYRDASKYAFSEWRHIIALRGAKDVVVRNLTFTGSGGDGMDMYDGTERVLVEDCVFVGNNRLGMGTSDVDGLTVRRCRFEANCGTPPAAGVDMEPNFPFEKTANVLFEDCLFKDHSGGGFCLHVPMSCPTTTPVTVTVRNCRAVNNRAGGYRVGAAGPSGPVRGFVSFENCVSEGNGFADLMFNGRSKEGIQLKVAGCNFTRTTITDYVKAETARAYNPRDYRPLGPARGRASSGWLRHGHTFLQYVPTGGTYRVRFALAKLDEGYEPRAHLSVTDQLDTALEELEIGPEGLDYTFTTRGENRIQFRLAPEHALIRMESELPGAAIRNDRSVHLYGNAKRQRYRIRVPGPCEEVRVNLRPDEPLSAVLYRADGSEATRAVCKSWEAKTLTAKRTRTSADEDWLLDFPQVVEDGTFVVAAPCLPMMQLVEESLPLPAK